MGWIDAERAVTAMQDALTGRNGAVGELVGGAMGTDPSKVPILMIRCARPEPALAIYSDVPEEVSRKRCYVGFSRITLF